MSFSELEKEHNDFKEQFFKKIEVWFLGELAKMSKEHNVEFECYYKTRIIDLETGHDYDLWDMKFDPPQRIQDLFDPLHNLIINVEDDLGYKFLAFSYTEDKKFLQ